MIVRKIMLRDFRTYEQLNLELSPGVNVLMGDNAQGKTNLLEAIGYCSTGRSHRTSYDRECVRIGMEESMIRLLYLDETIPGEREEAIEIHLRKNGKKSVIINRTPLSRINELFGCFPTVLFSPEDLSLIKDGPAKRRRFMDMEICQVDKIYLYHLQQFQSVLKQRNQLLKNMDRHAPDHELLSVYDFQFAALAEKIIERREEFVRKLDEMAPRIHESISGGKERIRFGYDKSSAARQDEILLDLKRSLDADLRSGTTTIGPHRDDIAIELDGLDVRIYGSQGQKRTTALSMKLAEVEMMQKETGKCPVLLLDDVMSELDDTRQKLMVESIQQHQTIITCTGVEDSIRKIDAAKVFKVSKGTVEAE